MQHSQINKGDSVPSWITHARTLFGLLYEQAEHNEYNELIWEGKLLGLYNQVGASHADYSRIMRLLQELGVIRYRQRGNRHQPTIIEILSDSPELGPGEILPAEHLTADRHAATMVAGQEKRLASLVAWRESLEKGGLDVAKVLQNYELRITQLEREVQRLGKKTQNAKQAK